MGQGGGEGAAGTEQAVNARRVGLIEPLSYLGF